MTRPSLDAQDRRILGLALVLLVTFLVACIVVGGGLGAAVLAFRVVAGW